MTNEEKLAEVIEVLHEDDKDKDGVGDYFGWVDDDITDLEEVYHIFHRATGDKEAFLVMTSDEKGVSGSSVDTLVEVCRSRVEVQLS